MIKNIYNKIRLNLGLKRLIEKILPGYFYKAVCVVDTVLILPVSWYLLNYLIRRFGYHFGADYRLKNYKSHNFDPKTSNLGYGFLHYAFIRNLKPKRVLCIGSMYGFIPAICMMAVGHNGYGVVDFVDAGYDMYDPGDRSVHNFGIGFWKKVNPERHFSYLNLAKYANLHIMTNSQFAKKNPGLKYDYIYIDGDHTYKGVSRDFSLFWPRLNRNGFVVFHDTDNNGKNGNLVYNVGKLLKEKVYPKRNYLHFYNPSSGLVIAQKK